MRLHRKTRARLFALIAAAIGSTWSATANAAQTTIDVFKNAGIQFGGNASWNAQPGVSILDNGRIIERTITLPELGPFSRVTTNLKLTAGSDAWDRAGNIYVATAAGDVELHKFITAFGGTTTHQQDITALIPTLRNGQLKIRAFVDTWVQAARTLDFSLTITDETANRAPIWGRPLMNDQDWRAGEYPNGRNSVSFIGVPNSVGKVILNYLPSGHASDGNGGDEFTQRTHRILIDGTQVWQGIPWRTDGRNFRSVNPTSGRWGDVWSSDLDRAGWIPGDDVDPIQIDVTQYLTPGKRHTVEYQIDGIRPGDSSGYGYWRASSYVTAYAASAGPADFDYNGVVDGADFLIWQRNSGLSGQVNNGAGDANGDGFVNGRDLVSWRTALGTQFGSAIPASVPEPAGWGAMLFALATLAGSRRWRALQT
ncbi:peptide-N-glycosidase F-related protein [Lacipirellula parvula]|uniref:Peptide-N-glycosidase F N-terminal domain-containing protein n=1 Tax=Lacipirellula parvula TaxID=2650471 RepID=A0A5K7XIH5_9BACT|nr:peptide-N-glycosidase F-related protein [Lacipirellula parvula]BBO34771.1 hypothetical protein PLANPX_4383 [Lacipirellula parvula]